MANKSSMNDLFLHELRDIYHAEKQLTKALPKMARAASSDELKQAFQMHLEQTQGQIERLEQVFDQLDAAKRGTRCEAMEGLVEEAREIMEEGLSPELLDAALIAAAQKVEHYEIASYGTLHAFAEACGMNDVAKLLAETLQEEKDTDAKLNDLAISKVNKRAMESAQS
jgi:ferritin-like metal-binding protein YciE